MSKLMHLRAALRAKNWTAAQELAEKDRGLVLKKDTNGRSLLTFAVSDGRWDEARWLLKQGADESDAAEGFFANLSDPPPDDIVLCIERSLGTCSSGNLRWGKWLVASIKSGATDRASALIDKYGLLPNAEQELAWSACMSKFDGTLADRLYNATDKNWFDENMARLGLDSLKARSKEGWCWLVAKGLSIHGGFEGVPWLARAAQFKYLEGLETMVEQGCLVDEKDCTGRTALYICVAKGFADGARVLLSAGANPELRQGLRSQGDSPLRLASKEGSRAMRKVLMPAMESISLDHVIPGASISLPLKTTRL